MRKSGTIHEEVLLGKSGTKPGEAVQGQAVKAKSRSSISAKPQPVKPDKAQVEEDRALYTNDNGSDGIVLLVDMREWGGDKVKLGELHRYLCRLGVRHRTASLQCGDYSWVWKCAGVEHVLPVLVERKRADDLAWSLKDGRYFTQKDKMLEFRRRFTPYSLHCSLKYIVECTPEQYMVRCADGCRGVARCGNPTVEQVNNVLAELDASDDFDLVRTENIEGTVEFLATVTAELQLRLDSGDFDTLAVGVHIEEHKTTDTKKDSELQENVSPWASVDISPFKIAKNPSMPSPDISPVRPPPLTTDSPQKSLLWNTTKTSPFKDTADFKSKVRGYGSSPSPEKTMKNYFPVSPAKRGQGSEGKSSSCRKSLSSSLVKSTEERPLLSPSRKRAVRKTPDFGDNSPLPKVQAMYDPTEYSRNRYRGDFDESSPEDLEESQEVESKEEKYVSIHSSTIETKPTTQASYKRLDSGFEDSREKRCHSDIDDHVLKATSSTSNRKRPMASRSSVFFCDSDSDNELPDITDHAPSPQKQRESSVKSLNPNTCKKKLGLDANSDKCSGYRQWKSSPTSKVTREEMNTFSKSEPSAIGICTQENELETYSLLDDSQETKDSDNDYDLNLWSMNAPKQKNSVKAASVLEYKSHVPNAVNTTRTKTIQKDSLRKPGPQFGNTEEPSTSRALTKQHTTSSLQNKTDAFPTYNQGLETISLLDDSQETRHSDDDLDQDIWPRPTDKTVKQEGPVKKVEAESDDEKWSEKVQLVRAVLPYAEVGTVLMMLQNNDGNVEAVVSALLDQADG
ncbi:MUS81 [Branchiostoma lanceolatum]|uniref:Crossover junction endonuclease MUS81 n=2 Tax=Branchiostoma lanceolatum TaxID=7740 RepID=A0A8J9ZPW3_BRALA|nr:MUS81 [Branchiostoma lanceolatum]